MKIYILTIIFLLGLSNVYAWDPTDHNKIQELDSNHKILLRNLPKWIEIEEKISEKYPDRNVTIDESDIDIWFEYLKNLGFILRNQESIEIINNYNKKSINFSGKSLDLVRDSSDILLDNISKHADEFDNLSLEVKNKKLNSLIGSAVYNIFQSYSTSRKEEINKFENAAKDLKEGRDPMYGKTYRNRLLAKNDVVAQVLNYASGLPEDGSGDVYYYPIDNENGKCLYKIAFNQNNPLNQQIQGLLGAGQFAESMGVPGLSGVNSAIKNGIDLGKADLRNVNFYKLQGAQKNKYTGVTAYLRYQSRVEGLPDIFECDSNSCNIDRLKRGWALVASKCKGTKKAF